MRANPFWAPTDPASGPSPSYIDGEAFARVLGAASFAYAHGLCLDTTVTITWAILGVPPDQVQAAFTTFLKCLRDWLAHRTFTGAHKHPAAWIYVHESGPKVGLHTHLSIFIVPELRSDFCRYVHAWARRFAGGRRPRAVAVRGSKSVRPWVHWLRFHYLLKGYDRSVEVCSPARAPGHMMLGDLIGWEWSDPGHVPLGVRVGFSRSLGPKAQAKGVPGGLEGLYAGPLGGYQVPIWTPAGWVWRNAQDRPWPMPFVSPYDLGVRDVRLLYPQEYLDMHWRGMSVGASTPNAPPDEENDDFLAQLEHLELI